MSLGRMNTFIQIVKPTTGIDEEGFSTPIDLPIASVRAYREGRHGTEKWANRAVFSDATDLFRFRTIPGTEITTDMVLIVGDHRYRIFSVEDIKGKKMYIEVLASEVIAGG